MKKLVIFLVLILLVVNVYGQNNVYVYKSIPSNILATDVLAGRNVHLIINDIRVLDGKTKVKFSSHELIDAVETTMKNVCDKAIFSNDETQLELIIEIDRYDVRFTGVIFTGITRYNVKININGDLVAEEVIEGLCTRGNVVGSATAKKVIQKSFDDANRKLIEFLRDKVK